MVRAVVKNTFVELEVEDDGEGIQGLAVKPRARCRSVSAGCLRLCADGEVAKPSKVLLDSLNRVLWTRAPVEPLPAPEKGPAVSELRDLQRRLSELIGQKSLADGGLMGSRGMPSSGSLSTAASDEEAAVPPPSTRCLSPGRRVGCGCKQAAPDAGRAAGARPMGATAPAAVRAGGASTAEARPRAADFAPSHGRVPRSLNLADEFFKSKHEVPVTTLMIRNIPNRYSQRELARELDELGLAGSYDFLYAPVDKGTMCTVGYAFVNCSSFARPR